MLRHQKHLFSLDPSITYLNCAYMSPVLKSVEEAGIEGIKAKRSPGFIQVKDFFDPVDELKARFSKLINCPNPQRIALIPAASYGLGIVAANLNLNKGDNIIVVDEQFPSNIYPWQRVIQEAEANMRIIYPPEFPEGRGRIWNERILEAIDSSTKMVALSPFHWADGTRFDLEAIRQKTEEVGALFVLDGTQSIGAYPFDIEVVRPDALICAGYKTLMGPYSLGLAYYGEYFDDKFPIEENWINRLGSEDFSQLVNYESRYQPFAGRFNVGEQSNFILVPMLSAALEQILTWTPENIQTYCHSITQEPIEALKEMGCKVEEEAWRSSHLFGVRLPEGGDARYLKQELDREKIFVSIRGNAVRISPHVYNEKSDLLRLVTAFERFCKQIRNH